ncbi:hypothetical protein D3C73_621160 [compost metagenome]
MMTHMNMMLGDKEVIVFFDSDCKDIVPSAMEMVGKRLSERQVQKIFNILGLVNITEKEATLFSLDGEMVSLAL